MLFRLESVSFEENQPWTFNPSALICAINRGFLANKANALVTFSLVVENGFPNHVKRLHNGRVCLLKYGQKDESREYASLCVGSGLSSGSAADDGGCR